MLGFLRLTTNRQVFVRPLRVTEATSIVQSWLAQPTARIVSPGDGHAEILFKLLDKVGAAANLTTDAHIAALAIEYRAEIATTDADFARFAGVRHFNPISRRSKAPRP
jgi:toxin-antitoxin system PIN domain toxin